MKYIKTPDLWDIEIQNTVRSGELKLQSGQWVFCGDRAHPSIFVGVNRLSGVIYAAHWNGSVPAQRKHYAELREAVAENIR